jgi:hypothetical protein
MVVVCDISAPPLDFDFNAPVAAWPYYGRVGPQWEVRQWRFFSLVFHTDLVENKRDRINQILLAVALDEGFVWAWREHDGLLPGLIRKRNLPFITALGGSWTSVLLLVRMIRSSFAFTCA